MGGTNMADIILTIISAALMSYLFFALVRPEVF